jgi:hypothetical protein
LAAALMVCQGGQVVWRPELANPTIVVDPHRQGEVIASISLEAKDQDIDVPAKIRALVA